MLGAGWVERQLQGDSGGGEDRAGAVPETQGRPWPGRKEERRAVKRLGNSEREWEAKVPGCRGPKAKERGG